MTAYYLPPDQSAGMSPFDGVIRDDGAWIPNAPDNRDWTEYETWRAEGNDPLDYPPEGVPGSKLGKEKPMTRTHAAQPDDNGTEPAETTAVESPPEPAAKAPSLEDRVAALEKTVARLVPLIGEP